MKRQAFGLAALAGIVGAAVYVLTRRDPDTGELRAVRLASEIDYDDLSQKAMTGLGLVADNAEVARPQLINIAAALLAQFDGSADPHDPATRQRAEQMVDQGIDFLRDWVSQKRLTATTVEGQVITPHSTDSTTFGGFAG